MNPTRQARERDLFFLQRPQRWPQWPFLPLVRRPVSQALEYGVLADLFGALELPGYGATVFRTNLFLLPRTLEDLLALPRETFDTVEELSSAGWTVD